MMKIVSTCIMQLMFIFVLLDTLNQHFEFNMFPTKLIHNQVFYLLRLPFTLSSKFSEKEKI